jgi:hypothetical protein
MMIKHVYKIEVKSTQSQESTELAQNAGVNIRCKLTAKSEKKLAGRGAA